MTSAQDFLTEFMKAIINSDPLERKKLIAEWVSKLEEREKNWPTVQFDYEGKTYKFPFKLGCYCGITVRKNLPSLIGGYTEEEIISAIKSGDFKPLQKTAGPE